MKHYAILCDIIGKSKETNQDIRESIVDDKSGSCLIQFTDAQKKPLSSVQAITQTVNTRKMSHHNIFQTIWVACLLAPEHKKKIWLRRCRLTQKKNTVNLWSHNTWSDKTKAEAYWHTDGGNKEIMLKRIYQLLSCMMSA